MSCVAGACIVDFVGVLLDVMSSVESALGRVGQWRGVAFNALITPVDQQFSFALERRWQCNACRGFGAAYERERVLQLPVPPASARPRSLFDLYMMSCVGGQARDAAEACVICGCAEKHVVQRRLATMPSVLLLRCAETAPMVACCVIPCMWTSLWSGQDFPA